MPTSPSVAKLCAIYIDMGTTNTRAWLCADDRVSAKGTRAVGVRDTARSGSPDAICGGLRELIQELARNEGARGARPEFVASAGMITSSLGLLEIPHVSAPAGGLELAESAIWRSFPEITELPFLFVPGVRSGPVQPDLEAIALTDVMRGEETLCVGLLASGVLQSPAVVMNLGSHWKAITLDAGGRVASSVTSLSGELIHAVQSQTILAGSIANQRPTTIETSWLEAGLRAQRSSGLPRALFCGRLLDLSQLGDQETRLAYIIGAVIAADLDALMKQGVLGPERDVFLVGPSALAEAWKYVLTQNAIPAKVVSQAESERALLIGLQSILAASLRLKTSEQTREGSAE